MKYTVSLKEVASFAQDFWKAVGNAKVFAFHGPMGAGKTTLIAALCHALGVQDTPGSPTYSIINEYADGSGNPVFHMDLYRLNDPEEVMQAGVEDAITSGALCLVEWPEKAPQLFDGATVHVYISIGENGSREVEVTGPGI